MKISVAIPAYNEEAYIAQCLDSLARQDFPGELEIVVCLNACCDKTEEIVRRWAQQSPWPVKVVQEMQKGVAWARQRAFENTTGVVIASADADTMYPPYWVNRLARAFAEDAHLVALYGPVRLRDFDGWSRVFWQVFHPILNDAITHIGRRIGWHNVIGSNFAVRREGFLAVGGFNTNLRALEDNEIVRRLRRVGRVRYDAQLVAYASARRYNRLGFRRTIAFYMRNGIRAILLNRETEDLEDLSLKGEP